MGWLVLVQASQEVQSSFMYGQRQVTLITMLSTSIHIFWWVSMTIIYTKIISSYMQKTTNVLTFFDNDKGEEEKMEDESI